LIVALVGLDQAEAKITPVSTTKFLIEEYFYGKAEAFKACVAFLDLHGYAASLAGECSDFDQYNPPYYRGAQPFMSPNPYLCNQYDPRDCSTEYLGRFYYNLICPAGKAPNRDTGVCEHSPKNNGDGVCGTGNPIRTGTGNKWQTEADLSDAVFGFARVYNAYVQAAGASLGTGWTHPYASSVFLDSFGTRLRVNRADGKSFEVNPSRSGWITDADISDRLVELKDASGTRTGWRYTVAADDSLETYTAAGKLLTIADRAGRTQTLTYDLPLASGGDGDPATLDVVTDDTGRQLRFTYDTYKRIATVTDPAGGVISYGYDTRNNLVSVTYPDGRSKTYHYNEPEHTSGANLPHALTGITDENGDRSATYQYQADGKAISTGHAGGADLHTLTYNPDGSTTVTDPLGTQRTHTFTTILGVVKSTGQTQPGGSGCGPASSATTYDANGNVASRADFKGNKTCYAYDLTRNLETARVEGLASSSACPADVAAYSPVAGTAQRKILTQWDSRFRLPVKVTEAGRETTSVYDGRGNVTSHSIKDTATGQTRTWTTTYHYHPSLPGVLSQKTEDGPRTDVADITTTDYYLPDENCLGGYFGCRAQVRQITNALGHVTQIPRYTAHGQPEEIVDPNGLVTALTYDARQRLIQRSVGSELTRYDYDAVGQLKQVTLPSGAIVRYDYDAAHRLTDIWDEENNRIRYTLDPMGNRIQEDVFNAAGNAVATRNRVFDALNRLWQDIGAVNAATGNRPVTTYGYDANGNLKTVQPPGQPATNYQYDALNRLFLTTDALGGVSQYRYDPLDQLREVRNPRNVATVYQVNAFGEETQVASPDSGTTVNAYDAAGNLKTRIDARGKQSTYSYDALNRLTGIHFASGNPISFSYDAGQGGIGRLAGMTDESGTTQWQYDLHGRVTLKAMTVGGVPRSVAYRYDPQGRLEALTYPSGKVLGLTWRAGKLDGLSLDDQPVVASVQYHPFSGPRQWSFGNGRIVSRGFDADSRLVSYPLGNSTRILSFDDAGRITHIGDSNPALNQGIQYDALDRVTAWATQLYNQGYSYDAGSNRTAARFGAVNYGYSVAPGSNRLQSVAGPTAKTYQFDAAGNVTHDSRTTFNYNDRGWLAGASNAQGSTSYLINGLGQRSVKTGLEGIRFVYDESGKLLGEYDPGGSLVQETVYLGDMPVAVVK
jgi:YD repeat-containing protein